MRGTLKAGSLRGALLEYAPRRGADGNTSGKRINLSLLPAGGPMKKKGD